MHAVVRLRLLLLFALLSAWLWGRFFKIVDMKYRGLSLNYASMGVDMKVDMGLEVFVSHPPF